MKVCDNPFDTWYVLPSGYTTCCQSWISGDVPVFDGQSLGPWQAWNHPNFVKLRQRMLNRNFSSCKVCPKRMRGWANKEKENDWKPVMERGPRFVWLTNDLACNLHCWSCRKSAIGRDTKTEERRRKSMMAMFNVFKPDIRRVALSQSGEALATPIHMEWLKSIKPEEYKQGLKIRLTTNGTLLTRKWPAIENAHECIDEMVISVDAATKDTYERVRLGGKWEDVKEGLEFASNLRASGHLNHFQTNFVVQEENFHEIPQFIRWCKSMGTDKIGFISLVPWWQSKDAVRARAPAVPSHPKHQEYLKILECEELRLPGVDAPELVGPAKGRQLQILQ